MTQRNAKHAAPGVKHTTPRQHTTPAPHSPTSNATMEPRLDISAARCVVLLPGAAQASTTVDPDCGASAWAGMHEALLCMAGPRLGRCELLQLLQAPAWTAHSRNASQPSQ